ncbi:hypothetical protein NIES2135_61090 (plasmid) [Leptolyngbya boryana NIES-2135]|uniref:Uncharacterized protein n=1 Tax=Leptolyngbya boryana NIES-2135 TaxID=1973484 RepID=A0A1Z4JR71_LEPBY|nr:MULTISPECIES: DUF6464 family protein [Leptolyngbya]BAY59232.1 hypothetical protein NIES2135_61090 [Leptolyngbya boryana NIES-2135]MBD2372822.1 hypothetical protein [Leptolyngbya sp. FACHB-238]MBD2397426.1 hypothetical protein [Leptolyngbya sp. FACHB-239]MBD2403769.1 hypothetical protein [Leptolyngbya sp. FACHB-402]ULP33425.1 DUF6464 family protein [Leptolyngbya boryana IU 594]
MKSALDALKLSCSRHQETTEQLSSQIRQEMLNSTEAINRLRRATQDLNQRLDLLANSFARSIENVIDIDTRREDDCLYFNRNGYIRCAVNPSATSCEDCQSFEPRHAENE